MARTRKPDLDGFRAALARDLRPVDHKNWALLRDRVVAALDADGRIVVQKARRTEKPEGILEVVCAWTGIDPDPDAAIAALEDSWPLREVEGEKHIVEAREETVVLLSAVKDGDRYLTTKVLVVP